MMSRAILLYFGNAILITGILSWWGDNLTPVVGAMTAFLIFGLPLLYIYRKEENDG